MNTDGIKERLPYIICVVLIFVLLAISIYSTYSTEHEVTPLNRYESTITSCYVNCGSQASEPDYSTSFTVEFDADKDGTLYIYWGDYCIAHKNYIAGHNTLNFTVRCLGPGLWGISFVKQCTMEYVE